jgi:hypothetical protein
MSLHEHLFSCLNVLFDKDTTSTIVYLILFEDKVRVMQGREGEHEGKLGKGL